MEFCLNNNNFKEIYKYYTPLILNDISEYENGNLQLVLPIIPKTILISLCENLSFIFQQEDILLEINQDCIVVGDLHGHILDLFRILKKFGSPPHQTYLFLGDIVDRGEFSLETITLIFVLKILWPKNIYIIRGNHEFAEMCQFCGFTNELKIVYNDNKIEQEFFKTFSNIPLGALIFNKIFCLHGGIGPSFEIIDQLKYISRPINNYNQEPIKSILWSDPILEKKGFSISTRGSGCLYGYDTINDFLIKNNLNFILRGHECIDEGVLSMFKNKLFTIFSASNYCGVQKNNSGIIIVSNFGHKYEPIIFTPLKYILRKSVVFVN